MAIQAVPGKMFKVTIKSNVTRAAAAKTLERLFMKDKVLIAPILARSKNFFDKPKRRGGCIWTKRDNKVHPVLIAGVSATVLATSQHAKDLESVADFVEVVVA
jgi:hypothetical protein